MGGAGRGSHTVQLRFSQECCCTVLVFLFSFPSDLTVSGCSAFHWCLHSAPRAFCWRNIWKDEAKGYHYVCVSRGEGDVGERELVHAFLSSDSRIHRTERRLTWWTRKQNQLLQRGSSFTEPKHTGPQIVQKGGVFGKLPYPCWKKVFWLHELPSRTVVPVIQPHGITQSFHRESEKNLKGDPISSLRWDTHSHWGLLPTIN